MNGMFSFLRHNRRMPLAELVAKVRSFRPADDRPNGGHRWPSSARIAARMGRKVI